MNTRLFVGNLPFDATRQDLERYFAKAGRVRSARIVIDTESGRSKGYGFVEMETLEAATNAIQLSRFPLGGRTLKVSEVKHETL